jgi:hypothetical protein
MTQYYPILETLFVTENLTPAEAVKTIEENFEPTGYDEGLKWLEETYTVADFNTGGVVSPEDTTTVGKWSVSLKTVFEPIEAVSVEEAARIVEENIINYPTIDTHNVYVEDDYILITDANGTILNLKGA